MNTTRYRRLLARLLLAFIVGVAVLSYWTASQYLGPNANLMIALERHDMAAAEFALQHGADPNLKVEQCWPTHILSDHISFFNAKVRNPRENGDWPLLLAETLRQDTAAVRLLLAHGANPDAKCYGTNAFRIAKNNKYQAIAAMLSKAGASE